jgi:type I restriction enzyme S subunit
MKQGWQIKKLGCLCSFERGLTYSKGDEAAISTKGVLRSNNVDLSSNTLNFDEIKYLKDDIDIPVSKKVKRNSILMCMSNGSKAHLGKVAIIEDDLDYAFGGFMGLLVPDEDAVFPRYFYYALITPIYKSFIKSLSDGANINNLKFADLKEFEIPVPSISEQQRIVALLDAEFAKIDAMKANAEKNLQNAKDLFQAALKKELEPKEGWKTKSLSQVVDLGTHISYGIVQPEEDIPNGVPIVRPMDLTTEILTSTTNLKRTKQSISEAYQRSILKGSEILMCVRGTTGIVSLSSIELKGCNTTRGIVPLCISDDKTRKFVYYVLRSEACQKYISEYTNGTALKQINIADVKNIPIVVAPYDEQATIIYRLDALNDKCKSLQANYKKTLSLCDDLKQALLRKAFNGEI